MENLTAFYRADYQKLLMCPLIKRLGWGFLSKHAAESLKRLADLLKHSAECLESSTACLCYITAHAVPIIHDRNLSLEKFWKRVWRHRLKTISMQWLLLIMRTMLLVIYQKAKKENMGKRYFTFWKLIPWKNCPFKITGKAVNLGDSKGIRTPCLVQFTVSRRFLNKPKYNWF